MENVARAPLIELVDREALRTFLVLDIEACTAKRTPHRQAGMATGETWERAGRHAGDRKEGRARS